jgi:uncharacterized repeat protein (TIGR01451 family)
VFDVAPVIELIKTADQLQVYAPGENVTFTVVIDNMSVSTDPVTINTLDDTIFGDLNGQGDCSVPQTIQPGDSYACSFTVFVTGDHTDVVTASGADDEGTPVSASDDATVDMIDPSLTIEKLTNGFDADAATGPEILEGADVEWTYVVTNTGSVDLTGIDVTDDVLGSICSVDLAVGESATCTATGTAVVGQYANTGTATFSYTDASDNTASEFDDDPSHYFGATPSVDVEKDFAGDEQEAVIAGGDPSSFTLVVTNNGNVVLSDVSVIDTVDTLLGVTLVTVTTASAAGGKTCDAPRKMCPARSRNWWWVSR